MTEFRYITNCVERFLDYVKIDTQSTEDSDSYPSTPGQLELLRLLEQQCREIGLKDVTMDEYGYVFATVPATSDKAGVPVIGFLAHVDTSPEMSGKDVKPVIHRNYDGGDASKHNLGMELDLGIDGRVRLGGAARLQLGAEGGVLFPGNVFDDASGQGLGTQWLVNAKVGMQI